LVYIVRTLQRGNDAWGALASCVFSASDYFRVALAAWVSFDHWKRHQCLWCSSISQFTSFQFWTLGHPRMRYHAGSWERSNMYLQQELQT